MLPGLHQIGRARRRRRRRSADSRSCAVPLAWPRSATTSAGTPMSSGQARPFGVVAAQHQRVRRPQHRVQVEQHVHRVDQRPDLARPLQLDGLPRRRPALLGIPDPVDVLIDEARCGRLARIEPLERRQVDEAEGQPAARRRQPRRAAAGPARSRRRSRCRASAPAVRHADPAAAGPRVVKAANAGVALEPAARCRARQVWTSNAAAAAARSRTCALPGQTSSAIRQAADERVAGVELLLRDPLVGLVRLRDVAGAADDRRDAGCPGSSRPRCRSSPCRRCSNR